MSEIVLQIDGKTVKATDDMTVLQAAQQAGISIPTLCHHEKSGAVWRVSACAWWKWKCAAGRTTWCPASTRWRRRSGGADQVGEGRQDPSRHSGGTAGACAARAGVDALAQEYGADGIGSRRSPRSAFSAACVSATVPKSSRRTPSGSSNKDRDGKSGSFPEIASKECWDCQECFAICPTSAAQAAYFLTEALAFPDQRKASSHSA